MLEKYFIKPETIDRIRSSWISEPIETYVRHLTEEGYAARTVQRRVPLLMQFGDFAHKKGATSWEELPSHIVSFAQKWGRTRIKRCKTEQDRAKILEEARNPIEQMLRLVINDFSGTRSKLSDKPFAKTAPGFFIYLKEERGLSDGTIKLYRYNLRAFETYLRRIGLHELNQLSSVVLNAFITERSRSLAKAVGHDLCSALRVFLEYLFRQQLTPCNLGTAVERPQNYRLSHVPRSIPWEDVRRMLDVVDRRTRLGKRDYAILLLLVTYGLRSREVAAMTLDNIDWNNERLFIPERKAGHSTAYPLSPIVGDILVDYLKYGRPKTSDRHLFFRILPPHRPLTHNAISCRTTHYLRKAGISVGRPGAHTLRHTCVQRLVDAGLSLKIIGDYVGHRSPESTHIYTKTAIESLRSIAVLGEEII